MQKISLIFAFLVFGVGAGILSIQTTAYAQQLNPIDKTCLDTPDSPVCSGGETDPIAGQDGIILAVVRLISFAVGVASVIMLILGGFKYITSNGDANGITSAKNTILYALIGLVVAAFSQAIVIFVISRL